MGLATCLPPAALGPGPMGAQVFLIAMGHRWPLSLLSQVQKGGGEAAVETGGWSQRPRPLKGSGEEIWTQFHMVSTHGGGNTLTSPWWET